MDYTILEIARAYSDDAETLVKNYNRIVEGIKSHGECDDKAPDVNVEENCYTEKDLVSFGNYLLSHKRKDLYSRNPNILKIRLEERLSEVNHSDIWNWKLLNDK